MLLNVKFTRHIKTPIEYLGHISSSYHSPNLNYCISMAMIKGGKKLLGKNYLSLALMGQKIYLLKLLAQFL